LNKETSLDASFKVIETLKSFDTKKGDLSYELAGFNKAIALLAPFLSKRSEIRQEILTAVRRMDASQRDLKDSVGAPTITDKNGVAAMEALNSANILYGDA